MNLAIKIEEVVTAREGDLDGKGKVNKTKVDAIIKARQNLYDELAIASKNGDLAGNASSVEVVVTKIETYFEVKDYTITEENYITGIKPGITALSSLCL